MGIYCTANNEVRANTGFQNTYSSSQSPTLVQVDYFIEQIEDELNLILDSIGVSLPVTNQYLLGTLTRYNAIGAAGMVLRRFGNADDKARADSYLDDYREFINKLISDPNYQNVILSAGTAYRKGDLAGTAVTQGYIAESTANPVYFTLDNFKP